MDYERRIAERAHQIWEEEGRPEGKDISHWELAKFAIDLQEAQSNMLLPVKDPAPEPIEALINQGEFPTLTDQGEQNIPGERNAQ